MSEVYLPDGSQEILIAGEGGQGIQTIGQIIQNAAIKQGLNSSYIPNFGVEQRGGVSLAFVKISETPIFYPKFQKADLLAVAVSRAVHRVDKYQDKETKIINGLAFPQLLKKRGFSLRTLNMLLLGIISKILEPQIKIENIKSALAEELGEKPAFSENLAAFDLGRQLEEKQYNQPLKERKVAADQKVTKANGIIYTQFPARCKSCGECLEKCPVDALSWDPVELGHFSAPIPKVDLSKCTACGTCERTCPDYAIKIEGQARRS